MHCMSAILGLHWLSSLAVPSFHPIPISISISSTRGMPTYVVINDAHYSLLDTTADFLYLE